MTRRRPDPLPVAVVGPGRVGRPLALALQRAGWPVRAVAGRVRSQARALARALGPGVSAHTDPGRALAAAPLGLLTIPGAALEGLATELVRGGFDAHRRILLHTDGTAPVDVLAPLAQRGAATGRLHPLFPFSGRADDAQRLAGVWFGVEGTPRATAAARRLVRALGGRVLALPAGGALPYHVSAVLASNLLVALAASAADLGPGYGRSTRGALQALLPLMQATLENLQGREPSEALTGPIRRGDEEAVDAHLRLLKGPGRRDLAAIYRALSSRALDLALETGELPPALVRALRRRIRR